MSKRRWEVYAWLFHNGPASANEVYRALVTGRWINSSSYLSRLSELRRMGVIQEVGEKTDHETKMLVLVWDVTNKMPTPLERIDQRMTRNQLIIELAAVARSYLNDVKPTTFYVESLLNQAKRWER